MTVQFRDANGPVEHYELTNFAAFVRATAYPRPDWASIEAAPNIHLYWFGGSSNRFDGRAPGWYFYTGDNVSTCNQFHDDTIVPGEWHVEP